MLVWFKTNKIKYASKQKSLKLKQSAFLCRGQYHVRENFVVFPEDYNFETIFYIWKDDVNFKCSLHEFIGLLRNESFI